MMAQKNYIMENIDEYTYISQPNRVIMGRFDGYTLMMHKILTAIALQLQEIVQKNMNQNITHQITLFEQNSDKVYLKIPYKMIVQHPNHYDDVKKNILKLASKPIEIPYNNKKTGEKMVRITGLFQVNMHLKLNYNSHLEVEMEKWVANLFTVMEPNKSQNASQFTKYLYEIAQNATSKYTPPVYKILASWREKGGKLYSIEQLKELLCIPLSSYKRYYDFKINVLKPVQQDLYEKADLWFDCNRKDFKRIKNGITYLNFHLITPLLIIERKQQNNGVIQMLKDYGFKEYQLIKINNVLNSRDIEPARIREQIIKIDEKIYSVNINHNENSIVDRSAYMFTSLCNWFDTKP